MSLKDGLEDYDEYTLLIRTEYMKGGKEYDSITEPGNSIS